MFPYIVSVCFFILFLLNLISIQVQLIIMSLKLICIIIYSECFDHVCSWNYNATLPYYANCTFSMSYICISFLRCISFLHATGYPSCALFLCVSSCRPLEAGGIWGDTTRGNTDKVIPFSYVLCLSTQSWHQLGEELYFNIACFLSFVILLLF